MVRSVVNRVFGKLIAAAVNGWLFAGTAIAAELDPAEIGAGSVRLKIAATMVLIGALLALSAKWRKAG